MSRTLCFLIATITPALSICLRAQSQPVRVLFVGDVMLDNGPGHIITIGGDPFAPTAAVLRDADLTIGNLECAITRSGHREDKRYQFKGPLEALPLLKKYFSAVSLANNHSGDWGKDGFADQLTLLRESAIPYFGGGATGNEAWTPLVLEARGKRVAFLGFNDFPPRRFEARGRRPGCTWLIPGRVVAAIRDARSRYHADYVLLFLHWGTELEDHPEPGQQALARRFIDAGADAVIGSHPHVTQTIDWHRGKPIVYSLGNYLFDYFPGDPPFWTAWMARVTLGTPEGVGLELFQVKLDPAGVPHLKSSAPEPIQPTEPNSRTVITTPFSNRSRTAGKRYSRVQPGRVALAQLGVSAEGPRQTTPHTTRQFPDATNNAHQASPQCWKQYCRLPAYSP